MQPQAQRMPPCRVLEGWLLKLRSIQLPMQCKSAFQNCARTSTKTEYYMAFLKDRRAGTQAARQESRISSHIHNRSVHSREESADRAGRQGRAGQAKPGHNK